MFRSQIQGQHYTDEDMMTIVDNSLTSAQPMLQNVLPPVMCKYIFLQETPQILPVQL